MRLFGRLAAVVVAAAFMLLPQNAAAQNIDLNLSLLVDVSGSVDQTEFELQRDGYVAAFQNSDVHAAIASLASDGGGVAVNVVYWDDGAYTAVNWTLLTDATVTALKKGKDQVREPYRGHQRCNLGRDGAGHGHQLRRQQLVALDRRPERHRRFG